jgi:U3 small nucleolar RNA-associated protein 25
MTMCASKTRDEWHRLYVLHVLNHVLTARGRIQRHNKQIKDQEEAQLKANKESDDKNNENHEDNDRDTEKRSKSTRNSANDEDDDEVEVDEEKWRDQGFTRPTVLVLLPTRGVAYRFVHDLLDLLGKKDSMNPEYMERLEAEYGAVAADSTAEGADDNDKGRNVANEEKERRRKAVLERKGAAWLEVFGDTANQDDDFKMGISLTPKAAGGAKKGPKSGNQTSTSGSSDKSNVSVKLYSDFYKSDIILASPLGLKVLATKPHAREPENNDDDNDDDGNGDFDYLSSIEICLVQYADILMMQNWDHVNDILSVLNQQPQKNNDTDFSRVRNYCLEGKAAHWRQLILSSHIMDPCILSTFTRHAKSIADR